MKDNIIRSSITIGIPAYNEEGNISTLIEQILNQDLGKLILEKVIVISDGSNDETVSSARKIKNTKIIVLSKKKRLGKNIRLNELVSTATSDILIILDADIIIDDKLFLQKLIYPIVSGVADMTSSSIVELFPKSLFEKVLYISMELKSILFKEFKSGNNIYNCHGPARAFSSELYRKLHFSNINADDMYSYLFCVKVGMKFVYVELAKVSYRLPSSLIDHFKQSSRYTGAIKISIGEFGKKFANNEFHIPYHVYVIATVKALPVIFSNLFLVFIYLFVYFYVHIIKKFNIRTDESWNVLSSKYLK